MQGQYQEIDLKEILDNMVKRWWLILMLCILGALLAFIISDQVIDPIYQADTTLFIGNEQNDIDIGISLSDLNRNSGLIKDYQNIAKTRLIIEEVMKQLGVSIPIKEFREGMKIFTVDDSRLFIVSYTSNNAQFSANAANEIAKQLSLAVGEIVGVENIRVLDKALVPDQPISPNIIKNTILGGLIGIVISMMINLILFLANDTIIKKEEIEKAIDLPVIGEIPKFFQNIDGGDRLVTKTEPNSYIAECYKILRSNINYLNYDGKNQVIMVTSSASFEGKTTTISNLALSMARDGKKTLLIDGDLRRPQTHTVFSFKQIPGLTNILFGQNSLEETVNHINGIDNLDVLTSGALPPAPDELLGTDLFKNLIQQARGKYDFILIDAPPVLSVSDASVLAQIVDATIVVVATKQTKKSDIISAKTALDHVGAKIIGSILTKKKVDKKGYYSDYYNH